MSSYGAISSEARRAYDEHDVSASKQAHLARTQAEEGHRQGGDAIKSIVYGGLDGVLTSFAIISGAAGGNLSPATVLILGVSNIVADAFSMGVGDTVSTLAYREHVAQERRRECWEFDNYREGEIEEMVDLYEQRGLPRDKAVEVINIMAKYKEFFIDVMCVEELQLKVPDDDDSPYREGFVTFCSFLVFGTMPLLAYLLVPFLKPDASPDVLFIAALVVTGLVLFLLGAFKSRCGSVAPWYANGTEFLLLGGAAASVSYVVGMLVAHLAHDFFADQDAIMN